MGNSGFVDFEHVIDVDADDACTRPPPHARIKTEPQPTQPDQNQDQDQDDQPPPAAAAAAEVQDEPMEDAAATAAAGGAAATGGHEHEEGDQGECDEGDEALVGLPIQVVGVQGAEGEGEGAMDEDTQLQKVDEDDDIAKMKKKQRTYARTWAGRKGGNGDICNTCNTFTSVWPLCVSPCHPLRLQSCCCVSPSCCGTTSPSNCCGIQKRPGAHICDTHPHTPPPS